MHQKIVLMTSYNSNYNSNAFLKKYHFLQIYTRSLKKENYEHTFITKFSCTRKIKSLNFEKSTTLKVILEMIQSLTRSKE